MKPLAVLSFRILQNEIWNFVKKLLMLILVTFGFERVNQFQGATWASYLQFKHVPHDHIQQWFSFV